MIQTAAARLLLLFAGGNGRYCGLAIVAEIGEGIFDASHFLDARRPEPPANARPTTVSEPFRKELESRESLVIPWTAPDSEVPHVEAGTSSDGRPARLALRE